mgnify:CR=1 FL=1
MVCKKDKTKVQCYQPKNWRENIYTGKEKVDLEGEILHFHVKDVDPVFVAQNIRILAPVLFPEDNCITADIDDLPLSRKYFVGNVLISILINL